MCCVETTGPLDTASISATSHPLRHLRLHCSSLAPLFCLVLDFVPGLGQSSSRGAEGLVALRRRASLILPAPARTLRSPRRGRHVRRCRPLDHYWDQARASSRLAFHHHHDGRRLPILLLPRCWVIPSLQDEGRTWTCCLPYMTLLMLKRTGTVFRVELFNAVKNT
jgi:hypothetical protein